jgi:hypothetical protein
MARYKIPPHKKYSDVTKMRIGERPISKRILRVL